MSFKIRTKSLFFVLLIILAYSSNCLAQSNAAAVIPNSQEKPVYISVNNLPAYQQLLLDRFVYWVKEQKIYPRVVDKLDYENAFTQAWMSGSKENADSLKIDEHGNLQKIGDYNFVSGFPFGLAEEINEEDNKDVKANKIIRNIAILPNLLANTLYNLNYNWIGTQSLLKKATAQLYRKYDSGLLFTDKSLYLQTVLKFTSPTILGGYSYLSKQGNAEDNFWIYSNLLGNLRKVPEEIKGDKLLGCNLNFDDIFVWNANPTTVSVKLIAEKEMLLPFPSLTKYSAQTVDFINNVKPNIDSPAKNQKLPAAQEDKSSEKKTAEVLSIRGSRQKTDGSFTFNIFNYENQQYAQLSSWSPISSYWIPRKVWVLEIVNKSGLYPYFKEQIVVDQEFMVPFFKVSYNHLGEEEKIVMASWAVAESKDKSFSTPFLSFVLAVENNNSVVCLQNTESVLVSKGDNSDKFRDLKTALEIGNYNKDQAAEDKNKAKKEEKSDKQENEYLD